MTLPITLTIAGAAALLNIWLGFRVSLLRRRLKVSVGDGDQTAIRNRMRAHANYVEYAPFFLILLAAVEIVGGSDTWLWLVAILFILGRLMHPFGMERPAPNALRLLGILSTWISLIVLAAYALALAYAESDEERATTLAAIEALLSGGAKLS